MSTNFTSKYVFYEAVFEGAVAHQYLNYSPISSVVCLSSGWIVKLVLQDLTETGMMLPVDRFCAWAVIHSVVINPSLIFFKTYKRSQSHPAAFLVSHKPA